MPILTVTNLSKRFPCGSFGVRDISFRVQEGEIFGIVGQSGAGKSTLLRLLAGLETPTIGAVHREGSLSMIFQHYNLLSSRTAFQNVALPLELAGINDDRKVKELLSLVGLSPKADHYPAQLSGGEKQRVAIARALAISPTLLLCDEPTAALDPATTNSILALLSKLSRELKLTIVIITHEMEVVRQIADRVLVLDHGEIAEMGLLADLFATPKHPVTKQLVTAVSHQIPSRFFDKSDNCDLLRLIFRGQSAREPLMTRLIRQFDIEVNILLGAIDSCKNEVIGNLVISLTGSEAERKRARQFLIDGGITIEELHAPC